MYSNIFQSENVPIKIDDMHEYILKKQMETKKKEEIQFFTIHGELYYSMYNYIRFMLSVKRIMMLQHFR